MPSLPLLCSSQLYHQLCTVQGQYNQYKGKPVCVLAGPLENINLEMCVYISLPLNQSGLNTIHSSHVLSKLLGKSRGTHHSLSFSFTHYRKLPPNNRLLLHTTRPNQVSHLPFYADISAMKLKIY